MRRRCGRITCGYRRRLANNFRCVDCGEPTAGRVISRGHGVVEYAAGLLLIVDIGVLQQHAAPLGLLFLIGRHRNTL